MIGSFKNDQELQAPGAETATVRANWRIVFRFEGTDAFDVELIDYH